LILELLDSPNWRTLFLRDTSVPLGADRKMAEYRAYILAPDDHVISAVDLFCPNDEAAKEKAKQLVNGHDVELWQLVDGI
jgi:hypothetical protein